MDLDSFGSVDQERKRSRKEEKIRSSMFFFEELNVFSDKLGASLGVRKSFCEA